MTELKSLRLDRSNHQKHMLMYVRSKSLETHDARMHTRKQTCARRVFQVTCYCLCNNNHLCILLLILSSVNVHYCYLPAVSRNPYFTPENGCRFLRPTNCITNTLNVQTRKWKTCLIDKCISLLYVFIT